MRLPCANGRRLLPEKAFPASGTDQRGRIERSRGDGFELCRDRQEHECRWLVPGHFDAGSGQVAASGQMTGTAIIPCIALVGGGLILICDSMAGMLLHARGAARFALLRCGGMAVCACRLHGDRHGERITAEHRQPDGQDHCNEFSGDTEHGRSLAKAESSVKYPTYAGSDMIRRTKFAQLLPERKPRTTLPTVLRMKNTSATAFSSPPRLCHSGLASPSPARRTSNDACSTSSGR